MAQLTGNPINTSYTGLIKTLDNAAITATPKALTDGSGNVINIEIGTGATKFPSGTVDFTGSTVSGLPAGSDTTYTLSSVQDGANSDIKLVDQNGSESKVTLVAGTNITLTNSGNDVTVAASGGAAGLASGTGTNSMQSEVGASNGNAAGAGSIAIGQGALCNSSGSNSISIGVDNSSNGGFSNSLGVYTEAGGNYASAFGSLCNASATNALAVGKQATCSGEKGVSIGTEPSVTVAGGVAIGEQANVTGLNGVSIGGGTSVTASGASAIGQGVTAGTADTVTMKLLQILNYASMSFADDAAAATGGIPLGGVYHTSGALKIRIA